MLFSRTRGKLFPEREQQRQVESETIARWRNIASSAGEESSEAKKATASRDIFLSEAIEVSEEPMLPDTENFEKLSNGRPAEPGEMPRNKGAQADLPGKPSAIQSSLVGRRPSWTAGEKSGPAESQSIEAGFQIGEIRESNAQRHKAAPVGDFSIPLEEDLKQRFGTNIRSALGPGTVIDGTFRFENPVCVDGTLTGEVCSSSVLIAGAQATVEASIIVGTLIVVGTVIGDVEADELVEIRAGGQLLGNVETRRIVIEEGGKFSGNVKML